MTPFRHTITTTTRDLVEHGGQSIAPYWRGEAGKPEVEHAYLFDNCDSHDCSARWFRGTGATLIRPRPTSWLRPDLPTLFNFAADYCLNGIVQDQVDWMIEHPRISNIGNVGIDFRAGAAACVGGQVYGCVGVGGMVRGPKVSITGTEFSDSGRGLVITSGANNFQGDALYSERCEHHNVLVGARAQLSNLLVVAETFVEDAQSPYKPTCLEFANRNDKDFGPLCANWSTLCGGQFDLLRRGSTGIHVNGAHMVGIRGDVLINGNEQTTGLLIEGKPDGLRAEVKVCGAPIEIRSLGGGCQIDIRWHTTEPRVKLPSTWPSTSHITINGVEVQPGTSVTVDGRRV